MKKQNKFIEEFLNITSFVFGSIILTLYFAFAVVAIAFEGIYDLGKYIFAKKQGEQLSELQSEPYVKPIQENNKTIECSRYVLETKNCYNEKGGKEK